MDYRDLVTSLESEAQERRWESVAELLTQAAAAITTLHNRAAELEADVQDSMEQIASFDTARH